MRNGPLQVEKLVPSEFCIRLAINVHLCNILCFYRCCTCQRALHICGAVVGVDFVGSVVGAGKAKGKPTQKIHRQTIPHPFKHCNWIHG